MPGARKDDKQRADGDGRTAMDRPAEHYRTSIMR
jgi:hypothetical protein